MAINEFLTKKQRGKKAIGQLQASTQFAPSAIEREAGRFAEARSQPTPGQLKTGKARREAFQQGIQRGVPDTYGADFDQPYPMAQKGKQLPGIEGPSKSAVTIEDIGVARGGKYGDTNVFRYDTSPEERGEYGKAIYSDYARGATPGGFGDAIRRGGEGVFQSGGPATPQRTDRFGNSLDIADSINRGVDIMRQTREMKQGGGQRQQGGGQGRQGFGAQSGVGGVSSSTTDKFGNPIQGGINQFQQAAMDIMNSLPVGKPGDYRKRQSMIEQARILSTMGGQQIQGMGDELQAQVGLENVDQRREAAQSEAGIDQARLAQEQQRLGIDAYSAMQGGKGSQFVKPYVIGEELGGDKIYSPAQAFDPRTQTLMDLTAQGGQSGQLYQSPEDIAKAVDSGQISDSLGKALMREYFGGQYEPTE